MYLMESKPFHFYFLFGYFVIFNKFERIGYHAIVY
ncbi:Uncharacterised protein [Myroides odoratus]|nr:hypothetical protein Myrod_3038 [Myroides odoratus DSM 2801]EKB04680.1 hypothetical protein HMPREF9716_03061 [Myroides odoratus CIP 103059]STZ31134.1 Uncharacterised protein [Myroides odoratus]